MRPHPHCPRAHRVRHAHDRFLWRWFLVNSIASGLAALAWLILRSGTRPSRLSYPCQRVAAGTAAAALGAPLLAATIAGWRRLTRWMRVPAIAASVALALVVAISVAIYFPQAAEYAGPVLAPPRDYRATLYHVSGCPQDPAGDQFVGWKNLVGVMARDGLRIYRSATESPLAGPDGIIAAGDVVVIKINYQWDQRGGTNTDLLRGMIRTLLDHPDGFTGEIVVCENAQFNPVSGFDRALNNAQDHSLSPHDVVASFQAQGRRVSHVDWTAMRYTAVSEYSAGDMADGYVVEAYDPRWQGKLSYPKFRTAQGKYLSLRYGIWDPAEHRYDRTALKFVNVPVLKSHHATYGATVSTKHYMGVVTDQFSTGSHYGIRYGIMGALMGEIQAADLNVVDAIWINANPFSGPSTSYTGATRRDELVASRDPIALDIWSVKNILIPGFLANGYAPPWPSPSADPDLATSSFRVYLDNSMNHLLAAGYTVTNNLAAIDVRNGDGAAGDFDRDGDVDPVDFGRFAECFTGPGGGPVAPECAAADFDGDGDVDCDDWTWFRQAWTSPQPPPGFASCAAAVPGGGPAPVSTSTGARPVPSARGSATEIRYAASGAGTARIVICDAGGRRVRTLIDRTRESGARAVVWDGRDDHGEPVAPGIYPYRGDGPAAGSSGKIVMR